MARGRFMSGVVRGVVFASGAVLLASCGFHPIYAPGASGAPGPAQTELAAIWVPVLPERSGQLLRQALQQRFEGAGLGIAKKYDLVATLSLLGEPIAIQRDTSITRFRVVGTVTWTLRDESGQHEAITTGTARSVDGYNVLDQQFFAAELENDTVTRRVARALADQITLQLASFFSRRAART